jgi:tRNA(Ile)-lysidine synthase
MSDLRNQQLPWPCHAPLTLPDGLGILLAGEGENVVRAPLEHEKITVRFTAQGRVRIIGRTGSRPIKKVWQELGVPPWQRERTPLLYYNEQLIAAIGLFITENGQPSANKPSLRLTWQK